MGMGRQRISLRKMRFEGRKKEKGEEGELRREKPA